MRGWCGRKLAVWALTELEPYTQMRLPFAPIISMLGLISSLLLPQASAMIRGINLYGFETELANLQCSWKNPPEFYLSKLQELGFNYIRLPFSYQLVKDGNFAALDHFLGLVDTYDLNVVLDFHRLINSRQSWGPTSDGVSMDEFVGAWIQILGRYKDNPRVVGADIFNEHQSADASYWNRVLHEILPRIEDAFPGRFEYFVGGHSWGGSLRDISVDDVPFIDRVHYTIHRYPFSGGTGDLRRDTEWAFGGHEGNMNIGEWGFKMQPDQVAWAKDFIAILKERGVRDTFLWAQSLSWDTGGLWEDDCQTLRWDKYEIVKTLWEDDNNEGRKTSLRGAVGGAIGATNSSTTTR